VLPNKALQLTKRMKEAGERRVRFIESRFAAERQCWADLTLRERDGA